MVDKFVTRSTTVTIANGASVSSSVNLDADTTGLNGLRLFGIAIPAAWTTADITFQVSVDNGATWLNVYDADAQEVTCNVSGVSTYVTIMPDAFEAITHFRARSGTSATPVVQGGDRVLTLVLGSR